MRNLICRHKEVILYLFFGVTTTAVNWLVYALLTAALHAHMTLANGVAWLAAVVYAFITNKLFVFESKSMAPRVLLLEGVKFFSARIASGILEVLLPTLMVAVGLNGTLFGLEGGIAKAVVSVVIIVMNYVLSKWLVFRNK